MLGLAYFTAAIVTLWALTVCLQTLAALLPVRLRTPSGPSVNTVVVIPAHNEELCISRCLKSVRHATDANTRVLVVADNCIDRTAALAAAEGAEVVERHEMAAMGKPYALQFAVEHLREDPPDVVVFVDADGVVGGRGLSALATAAHAWGRPAQALNLVDRRLSPNPLAIFSVFGNRFHNLVRPLGNRKLGLPCLLNGSGMAIPWPGLAQVGIRAGSLGEDKQLGVDLAIAGWPPRFFPLTKVSSRTPTQPRDYLQQRQRWEQGHLATAARCIPRLLFSFVTRGRLGLLWLAAELFVPPLAVVAAMFVLATGLSAATFITTGATGPILMILLTVILFLISMGVTWSVFCRRLPLRALLTAPIHVARKLPIYLTMITKGPQSSWLHSERGP